MTQYLIYSKSIDKLNILRNKNSNHIMIAELVS